MNINITNRTYSENFQHLQPVSSHKSQSSVSFLDAMKAVKTDTVTVSNTPDLKKFMTSSPRCQRCFRAHEKW